MGPLEEASKRIRFGLVGKSLSEIKSGIQKNFRRFGPLMSA